MSAFLVTREHLIYMVEAAASRRLAQHDGGSLRWVWGADRASGNYQSANVTCCDTPERRAEVASMLRRENVASIEHRYPDTKGHAERRPGKIAEPDEFTGDDFRFAGFIDIDPAQVMRACSCYEYQACEHDGWEASEACAFTRSLYKHAAEKLANEDAARRGVELAWGIDELPRRRAAAVVRIV